MGRNSARMLSRTHLAHDNIGPRHHDIKNSSTNAMGHMGMQDLYRQTSTGRGGAHDTHLTEVPRWNMGGMGSVKMSNGLLFHEYQARSDASYGAGPKEDKDHRHDGGNPYITNTKPFGVSMPHHQMLGHYPQNSQPRISLAMT